MYISFRSALLLPRLDSASPYAHALVALTAFAFIILVTFGFVGPAIPG